MITKRIHPTRESAVEHLVGCGWVHRPSIFDEWDFRNPFDEAFTNVIVQRADGKWIIEEWSY